MSVVVDIAAFRNLPAPPSDPMSTLEKRASDELLPLFDAYEKADTTRRVAGEVLGRALVKWRDQYKAQGSRKKQGFSRLLETLHIPRRTAYNLIKKVTAPAEPNLVPSGTKSNLLAAFKRAEQAASTAKSEIAAMTTAEIVTILAARQLLERASLELFTSIVHESYGPRYEDLVLYEAMMLRTGDRSDDAHLEWVGANVNFRRKEILGRKRPKGRATH